MAETNKPVILIVCSGWHVPASYDKLTKQLRLKGFEVHIPPHPSMNGSRPPDSDLKTDTDNIREHGTKLIEDGRHVAVLMHSYGGQVGTNALHGLSVKTREAQGLKGGISHLIYMTAHAMLEGQKMMDLVEKFGHMQLMKVAFESDDDKTCVLNFPKKGLVGEEYAIKVTRGALEAYTNSLGRWNGECLYQPLTNKPAWRDHVKIAYLHCVGDITLPMDYQKTMVEAMEKEGVSVHKFELDAGHAPHLTATVAVVAAVIDITSDGKGNKHVR